MKLNLKRKEKERGVLKIFNLKIDFIFSFYFLFIVIVEKVTLFIRQIP